MEKHSLTDHAHLTDAELHALVLAGDAQAENELVLRYSRLVRVCARPFFLVGGDSEDLTQEGMMGLLSAIREYRPDADTSFKTYAELCIRRRLISAVRAASRLKHAPLNEGVSFEEILSEETQSRSVFGSEQLSRNPEEQVLARESKNDYLSLFSRYLSKLEIDILTLYLDGMSYAEIAQASGRAPKSVDNAVQRIRKKLAQHLTPGDFS